MAKISGGDVQGMVSHWLKTPVNGYLGSSYGSTLKDMLQQPQSRSADEFLSKLRRDVPVVQAAAPGTVNLYANDRAPDRRSIVIEIGDLEVSSEGMNL